MRTSLSLSDQDVLVIEAHEHTRGLAASIAREAYLVGADVSINYMNDELFSAFLTEMNPKYLLRKPKSAERDAEIATAHIGLFSPEDPKVFDRAKPERMHAMDGWSQEISDRMRTRKVRDLLVTLALVTPQRARKYGVSFARWKRIVNASLAYDLRKIRTRGQTVAKRLGGASEVQIVGDGTDLTVSLSGREPRINDGIVDANDVAIGDLSASLPAGFVVAAPEETSAEGKVTFPTIPLWGKVVRDLRWTFRGGHLVDYHAEKNETAFRDYFESAHGDKDRIGSVSIGLNPKADYLGGFTDSIVSGAIGVNIGQNEDLGGTNKGPFLFGGTLPKATVRADGTNVVNRGVVKA